MPTDRHGHDLAEDGLVRSWADVPAAGQHGQAEQHDAEDHAEQQLGALGPDHPGLLEQRDAVGDRLHAGERAATGREGLEHQQHADRLEPVGGQEGVTGLGRVERQRVDQPDGDDGRAGRR